MINNVGTYSVSSVVHCRHDFGLRECIPKVVKYAAINPTVGMTLFVKGQSKPLLALSKVLFSVFSFVSFWNLWCDKFGSQMTSATGQIFGSNVFNSVWVQFEFLSGGTPQQRD
jgi:hypothetical protein